MNGCQNVVCTWNYSGAKLRRNSWHREGTTNHGIKPLVLPLSHHLVDHPVLLGIQYPEFLAGPLAAVEELGSDPTEETDQVSSAVSGGIKLSN